MLSTALSRPFGSLHQRALPSKAGFHTTALSKVPHKASAIQLISSRRHNRRSVVSKATDDFRPDSPKQEQQQQQNKDELSTAAETQHNPSSAGCPFHEAPVAATAAAGAQSASSSATATTNPSNTPSGSSSGSSGLQGMKGPGWRVLPSGAAQQLPEVPCRPVVVDEANPMGEFGEFEAAGAGGFFLQRYKEFGPLFSWQMGPMKMVTLLDYEAIKTLLQADNKVIVGWNPEPMYIMLGERTRENMETPSIRVATRRMLQPGFIKEAMAGYINKLVRICRAQLEEWSSSEGPVDLAARGKDLSFEFSTQLVVDFEISPEQKPALRAKFDALFQGIFSPPDPTPGSRFCLGMEARDQLLQDLEELVRAREDRLAAAAHSSSSGGGSSGGSNGGTAVMHKNVLDYTLDDMRAQNEGKVDLRAAAQNGMGLIIAANDTSGLGVSALLATLPFFPDVMDKLREEQQKVLSKFGPAINPAALDAMPYADAVIREVLRIAPPAASVFRRTLVDMEICGKFVPANTPILLSTFMAQVLTDPHLQLSSLSPADFEALEAQWTSVTAAMVRQEFKPERWLQREGKGGDMQKPSGLLTFSYGPHICLGMGLFFAEAKVLLALLAREYDLTLDDQTTPDLKFQVDFNAKLKQGAVKFTKKEPVAA